MTPPGNGGERNRCVGVHCYAPDGTLLGRIRIPTMVANLTFGGPRRNRLFITASNALYSVFVATSGAQTP